MSSGQNADSERERVRIAQISILNNKDGEEYRYNFLAHSLKRIDADIVAVQEIRNCDLLQKKLFDAGYVYSVIGDKTDGGLMYPDGVGVFSKKEYPIVSQQKICFPFKALALRNGVLAEFSVDNAPFYVYSGHFAWNMLNESIRLLQAQKVAGLARALTSPTAKNKVEGKDTVFILSGDLNAGDKSRTYRYLTGLDPLVDVDSRGRIILNPATTSDSTFFIDAYEFSGKDILSAGNSGNVEDPGNWETTDQGNNYWGRKTSVSHGIEDPRFIPKRRIDYILSHGWQYGKRGCPTNYHRFGNPEPENGFDYDLSDHYGIYSDIMV